MKKRLQVLGWAFYDFAGTIFSLNVISLYFVLWVTVDKAREDILYSLALSGSLLVAAVLEPLLGTLSDIYRKRIPFLVLFTLSACVFTAFLGVVPGLFAGLLVFAFANLTYQIASIFYNALLVNICDRSEVGRVSGLGVALGYAGAITGLLVTRPFVLKHGHQGAFVPTAALFLVFSLPCFFLVKEGAPPPGAKREPGIGKIFSRIKETFVNSEKYPGLARFLLAAFIFLNAVNTLIVFMSVYVKKVAHFSDSEMIAIYIVSTVVAIIGSVLFGFVTDRVGPRKAIMASLSLWLFCLVFTALAYSKVFFWIIGPLLGVAMGSIWTASRVLVIELSPEEKLGEVFGLLGAVGKSSAMVGPLVWGISVLVFGFMGEARYRAAMLIQSLFVLAGFFIIRKVPCGSELKR